MYSQPPSKKTNCRTPFFPIVFVFDCATTKTCRNEVSKDSKSTLQYHISSQNGRWKDSANSLEEQRWILVVCYLFSKPRRLGRERTFLVTNEWHTPESIKQRVRNILKLIFQRQCSSSYSRANLRSMASFSRNCSFPLGTTECVKNDGNEEFNSMSRSIVRFRNRTTNQATAVFPDRK